MTFLLHLHQGLPLYAIFVTNLSQNSPGNDKIPTTKVSSKTHVGNVVILTFKKAHFALIQCKQNCHSSLYSKAVNLQQFEKYSKAKKAAFKLCIRIIFF